MCDNGANNLPENMGRIMEASEYFLVAKKKYATRNEMMDCVAIHQYIYEMMEKRLPVVKVPAIYNYGYDERRYVYCAEMEHLPPPLHYSDTFHITLGTTSNEWSYRVGTSGFYGGPTALEHIWDEEGSETMEIDELAYLMGRALRIIINGGIVPRRVRWIWSKKALYMTHFDDCLWETISVDKYLSEREKDIYLPNACYEGYESFVRGLRE
jgi:hypothetical protein